MKIVLVYLRIVSRVQPTLPMIYDYSSGEHRFLETYRKFLPKIPHDLLVVNCGHHNEFIPWDSLVTSYAYYDGFGSDCGTYQFIGKTLDCDLVICCNTIVHFWREGWMEPFVMARTKYGPGVYGPTASFENHPHLRTPCIAFEPSIMRRYPHVCDSRQKAVSFESGSDNFSLWASKQGIPSILVLRGGFREIKDWRRDENIFRRGDQSNCLVWDRHTEVWAKAGPQEKRLLSQSADGVRNT